MRAVQRPDFDFIIGTEALLVPAVVAGAKACVSGVANTFPDIMRKLWDAAEKGEWGKAMDLQQKVNQIREVMHLEQLDHLHAHHASPARDQRGCPPPPSPDGG
jgi:dihydrodipicolinate synthase/N-acetylneuraminate lyase